MVATPEAARAAIINVDINNEGCSVEGPVYCTIEQGYQAASAGDTIQVAAGTYAENLFINKDNLTISGAGAGATIITAAQTGTGQFQIIEINGQTTTVENVTLTGADTDAFGGAIQNGSTNSVLTIRDSEVSGNQVTGGGAGIFNNGGQVTIIRTVISDNTSTSGTGGGIYNRVGGTVSIVDSTVSGNTSGGSGGGIAHDSNVNNTLTMYGSTVTGNLANSTWGGGLFIPAGVVTIENSTLSGNSANNGGGLAATSADANVQMNNTTIAQNSVSAGHGGGLSIVNASVAIANTIITDNINPAQSTTADCSGGILTVDAPSIVGKPSTTPVCTYAGPGSVLTGTTNLTTLADNGGLTQTYLPDAGTVMVDTGSTLAVGSGYPACAAVDQRGETRPQGSACDIGSVELAASATPLQDLIDATPAGQTLAVPDGAYNELITIGQGKTLQGSSPDNVIIDGSNLNGTVVTAEGDFAIEGIQITGGNVTGDGGGIFIGSEMSGNLTNVVIAGNTASSEGGGVYVSTSSSLTVTDSEFSGNDAGSGGAIYDGGAVQINGSTFDLNTAGSGGAIYQHWSASPLNINAPSACAIHPSDPAFVPATVFSNNSASSGGAIEPNTLAYIYNTSFTNNDATNGGALYLNDWTDPTYVTCSLFELNEAVETGGAVSSQDEGNLIAVDTAFDSNTSGDWGGAIGGEFGGFIMDIEGSTFTNNDSVDGGAIYAEDETFIRMSTFSGNNASVVDGWGGAIYWDGSSSTTFTLDQSTVDGNTATVGGGLYLGGSEPASIWNSTISNNSATSSAGTVGGGILTDGELRLTNSTISGNTAGGNGAGIGITGGGEFSPGGNAVLNHVTIAGNSAGAQGGAFYASSAADITISNSISNGNSNQTGGPNCFNLHSLGHNILGGAAGCLSVLHPTDSTGAALIGPLADNGGPTLTHLPQSGSPAIDGAIGSWQLNGAAGPDEGLLLAPPSFQVGSAFLTEPFDVSGDFSASFQFQITPQDGGGADGLTFSIFDTPGALGIAGGYLGIATGTTGSPDFVAIGAAQGVSVEFDTWVNGQGEGAYDPNGNHVGIDIDGDLNSVVTTTSIANLSDGSTWTAWIDYVSGVLEVRASNNGVRPVSANVSYEVDIAAEVGGPAYVGFTGATGSDGISGEQRVFNLVLDDNPADQIAGVAVCDIVDQRGIARPQGAACDIGAVEVEGGAIPTVLSVEISDLGGDTGVTSSLIPIEDLNVGTFFGASEGPSSTQLGAIQLGAIQLGAIQLGAIGLADAAGHMTIGSIIDAAAELAAIPTILDEITLVDVPVVGGWEPILAGTDLAGRQTYTITLQQAIDVVSDLDVLRDLRIADSGLTASQLGAIQLGAIQLGAIQLGAIQLGAIQLGAIGDQLAALCAAELDCDALGINPAVPASYDGYSIMALTLMGVDLDFAQLGAIQLGAIDPSGTQLGAIQLGAIQLGAIDLTALTIGNTQLGAIQLGAIQLGAIQLGAISKSDLVTDLCNNGLNCSDLGIDTGSIVGDELDGYSLLALGAMGADLESTQLGAIQLGAIQLGAIGDLKNTQLGAIQLGAIQLGAIDPENTQLGAIQLGAIQLGAIQLGAIDWNNPVFAQLGAIQLGAIQLGAIDPTGAQLGAIQLGAIQLGAITNPSALISCGSLAGGCSANGTMTLYEIQELGLFLSTATLDDLVGVMDDVPLSDLIAGGLDIVDLIGTASLLDLLPETTIADLPPDLTLGQLAELWVGMPLFELLLALLNPGELGWEDVDPAVLAAQHPFNSDWSVTFNMSGEPGQVPGAEFPFSAEVAIALPSGVAYVAGSAELNSAPLPDPEIDGNTLRWILGGVVLNDTDVVSLTLATAFTVDSTTPVTATVNTLGYTASDSLPAFLTDLEPNDTFAQANTRAAITSDVIVLGRVDTPGDVDIFKIEVPAGGTIEAYLNPGGTDLDLVLFEAVPFTDGALRGAPERIVDGSLDPTIGIDPVEQDQESLADIANTDVAPVFKASLHRSSANETIVTPPLRNGGTYYLQTTSYNGASSDSVYVERIRVINPPASSPCLPRAATSFDGEGTAGSLPTAAELAGAQTIYLMNMELFGDTFGAAATSDVMTAIAAITDPVGVVVPVEGDATVAAAYASWLAAPGNCNVDAANDVATAIAELVDGYRAAYPSIASIVIVGGDDQIPFFRVEDQGIVANEREYRTTFTGNNPLVGSLAAGMVLTDAPFTDANPLYVAEGDREIFIPQLPTGRLVDQPEEIIAALAQYVASGGELDTATAGSSAQVLGYDFLADSSQTIADNLLAQGFNVTATISETWDKIALKNAMDSGAAIVNPNAHYDHTAALPAAGNLTNSFTNLYQLADLQPPTSTAYEGTIIFSMGCHAGLNAADSYLAAGDPAIEWAQELLLRRAVFVGNTGFGYGDSDFEAYSEELMSLFAEGIGTTNTIGEAFVAAQQTLAGKTAKWSPYHDKSQMEATLYGLPFYQLHDVPVVAPPNPTITPTGTQGGLQTATVSTSSGLTERTTADGAYLVSDDVLAVPFRPVQPLEILPVTPSTANIHATGAIIEGGTSADLTNYDVLYARPILYNELAEPETETTGAFPNALQAVTSFQTPNGRADQLLLARGRYFPGSRTQQRWDSMELTVYYAPDSVTDVTPPNIDRTSAVEVSDGTVVFQVNASGGGGIERAVVLYKAKGTDGAWTKLELIDSSGTWTGVETGLSAAQNLDFFVQVLGSNGQVSTSTDKAEMHQVQPPGPPAIHVDAGMLGNNGIYKTAVQVSLASPSNAPGVPLEYSVDGEPFAPYSGTFTLDADGTRTVVARPSFAPVSTTTRTILIDKEAPVVTVVNPAEPILVELGVTLPLRYFCTDAVSGIAKCKGSVGNGQSLDTTVIGGHVAQVTATDKAGNTTVQFVPYEVVLEGPITLTADADVVAVDTTVTFTTTYLESGDPHQVDWDFDGDGAFDTPSSTSTSVSNGVATAVASYVYASVGVYPVEVRVAHGTGLIQTEVLRYVVVYDPSAGFVTGGGWFDSPSGAYTPDDPDDPDVVGRAKFGFVSKYKKGAKVPTGNTSFEFVAGSLDFNSTSYDSLVVTGNKAQYKGVGTVEGFEGDFKFRLTARDADINTDDGFTKDGFRIQIWQTLPSGLDWVLYDNGLGVDPATYGGTTELGGGSIKIHVPKGKGK